MHHVMSMKRYRRISRYVNYLVGCVLCGSVINLMAGLYRSSIHEGVGQYVTAISNQFLYLIPYDGNHSLANSTTHGQEEQRFPDDDDSVFRFLKFDRHSDYLFFLDNVTCFKEGTYEINSSLKACLCKEGWHGISCSIPSVVYLSQSPWKKDSVVLRRHPRRIIQAFPFNMEFEMLEIRLEELAEVVDVFLVLESNYTAYGTGKDLHLLKKLRKNDYSGYSHKMVHVFLDYFPEEGRKDGWVADGLHRNYIGTHGLRLVKGWRLDDLFVLTDADEVPSREMLTFLKWHDGYTEPVAYTLRWSVFGFFWSPGYQEPGLPKTQTMFACVTMRLLVYVFRFQAYHIRAAPKFFKQHELDVNLYVRTGGRIEPWTVGTGSVTAGWHCSWCLDPERIRIKLLSAQNGDFPRWGDIPEKSNISYIKSLVARGVWFDERSTMVGVNLSTFVPRSVLANQLKYAHLVANQYAESVEKK